MYVSCDQHTDNVWIMSKVQSAFACIPMRIFLCLLLSLFIHASVLFSYQGHQSPIVDKVFWIPISTIRLSYSRLKLSYISQCTLHDKHSAIINTLAIEWIIYSSPRASPNPALFSLCLFFPGLKRYSDSAQIIITLGPVKSTQNRYSGRPRSKHPFMQKEL